MTFVVGLGIDWTRSVLASIDSLENKLPSSETLKSTFTEHELKLQGTVPSHFTDGIENSLIAASHKRLVIFHEDQ